MTGKEVNVDKIGTPMLAYRKLGAEWRRCDNLKNESRYVIELFLLKLSVLCDKITSAGVVHLDLRLLNIFYCLALKDPDIEDVHIKIIDWDDSVRVNELIPADLINGKEGDGGRYLQKEEAILFLAIFSCLLPAVL